MLSQKELAGLPSSLLSNMVRLAEGKSLEGLARSTHDALSLDLPPNFRPNERSILVPFGELCRTMTATGGFTTGGALVENAQTAVEAALLPVSAVRRLGARIVLNGKTVEVGNIASSTGGTVLGSHAGTVAVLYDNGNTSGAWYDETETAIPGDNTISSLHMSPHRWSLTTSMTTQLAAQSTAPEVLVESITRQAGSGLDQICIAGSGANGEAVGIQNQTGVGAITFGGAATWAKVLDFVQTIENAKAEPTGWILSPDVKAKWSETQRWTGASVALYNVENDTVAGKKAISTTHASATLGAICGAWDHYRIALWGANAPIEILVNPYSPALAGKIEYTATLFADCGTGRPTAFCRAADTAVA